MTEERDLIIQSMQGNTEAYSQLISKYANAVYAVAIARLGDIHGAEDVAQDTFVKAWFNLNKLDDPGRFCGWITTIARNAAEDWARKNKPVILFDENHIRDRAANFTEETVLKREQKEAVWQSLNKLDEKYRLVSILYFISDFNSREIARFLGISLSAVESRLRRSKEKLKKELFEMAEQTLVSQKLGEEFESKVMKRGSSRYWVGKCSCSEIHNPSACVKNLIGRGNRQGNRLTVPSAYEAGSQGGKG